MKVVILALLVAFSASHDLLRAVNHQETIDHINSVAETWVAGHNPRFDGMTLEDVKGLLGSLETPEEEKLPLKEITPLNGLPENFDLRTAYPECEALQEVRDQSKCGSCWAFGSAEAMSDRICIASKGQLQTRISADNILSCCRTCGSGCNGGYPAAAWSFFKNTGVPTGGLYQDSKTCQPYSFPPCDHHVVGKYGPCNGEEFSTPKCKKSCQNGYPVEYSQDKWYAESSYSVSSKEEAIMTEIFTHGSVTVSFSVYEDFVNYTKGIYEHKTGKSLGGHAIKMIGWGVENGVKYWILVNSWNEGWGENGTWRMIKGKNHCNIEGSVVAGIPKLKTTRKFLFEQQ